MKCTHPVIYEKDGKMVCQVCGAAVGADPSGAFAPPPLSGEAKTGKGKKKGKAD